MRLIDADALEDEVDTWGCNDYDKYDFIEAITNAPTVTERPIRCQDCKHQVKVWREDKRMGGYWVYDCDFISDPFESTPVCGEPEEYCSSAEKKEGAE